MTAQELRSAVQDFLNSYSEATRRVRDTDVLARYWSFPAQFYHARVNNVNELLHEFPPLGAAGRCKYGAAQVVSIDDFGSQLSVMTKIPWTLLGTGLSGVIGTRYTIAHDTAAHAFKIRGARDEPEGQKGCRS